MRLIILTTGSVRRRYYVNALQSSVPVTRVFVETGSRSPPFDTHHPYEDDSKVYEKRVWFNDAAPPFDRLGDVECFTSLNDRRAVRAIAAAAPDVIIVFGTGKLNSSVMGICPRDIYNIHSGNPERYRGLDAHLWAIYHRDFGDLIVTLHRVTPTLDRGEIFTSMPVCVVPQMRLHQFRRASTEAAVAVSHTAIEEWLHHGGIGTRPQRSVGRYYSFMPVVLKDICVKRFERYTAQL